MLETLNLLVPQRDLGVSAELLAPEGTELAGRHPARKAEVIVIDLRPRRPPLISVKHRHPTIIAGQRERCGEPRGPPANNQDFVCLRPHACSTPFGVALPSALLLRPLPLLLGGQGSHQA